MSSSRALAGLLAALVPAGAHAELAWNPFVAGRYEYDSNVFALASPEQGQALNGTPQRDDRVTHYAVGLDPTFSWNEQRAHVRLERRWLRYQRFDDLDHEAYRVDAAFDWRATSTLGGSASFRQDRRMASFADRQTNQLTLEREREGAASVEWAATADWRIEAGLRARRLESPLTAVPATPDTPAVAAAPDFALRENAVSVAFKYAGLGRLSTGLQTEVLEGRYTGVPDAPRFAQGKLELTLSYALSGLSTFDGAAGYTRRANRDGGGDLDEFTGALAYRRALTGKTHVQAQVFRRISSYVSGADSTVDTGIGAGMTWRPTVKVAVSLGAEWARTRFAEGAIGDGVDEARRDRYRSATLDLRYDVLQWLTVRPYGSYRERDSDSELDRFRERILGLELEGRLAR
ncbi:MAG TPA: hypothetical protein VJM11_05890 [Nevskiaceae bacterium]|nr:hypothetical protein [Nevskiaceae bacterium]